MKRKQRQSSKKAAPRKAAPRKAPKQQAQQAAPAAKAVTFPALAHVAKGGDAIPVQVADQAHLDRLVAEHGASSVQVQS